MKKYKVLFFTSSIGPNGLPLRDFLPSPLLTGISVPENLQSHIIDDHQFQLRDFERIGHSQVWRGVFGRLRDDAPNVVNALGQESVIPLQPTDRLLEKCHFIYFANHDVLVWQVNNDVAYISKFYAYLSAMLNLTVAMNSIFGTNALQRVIAGSVKSIECKVATPRVPLTAVPNYSQPMFDLMNSVHGSSIKVNISAGRGTLTGQIRRMISWAVQNPETKMLRAKIEGEEDPIDLLADRISDNIRINLYGHYPNPVDVFNGLDQAFTDNRQELAPFFR